MVYPGVSEGARTQGGAGSSSTEASAGGGGDVDTGGVAALGLPAGGSKEGGVQQGVSVRAGGLPPGKRRGAADGERGGGVQQAGERVREIGGCVMN